MCSATGSGCSEGHRSDGLDSAAGSGAGVGTASAPAPVGLRPVDGEGVLHEDHGVVHIGGAELAEAVVGEGAVRVGGELGARTVVAQEELHELHQRHGPAHPNSLSPRPRSQRVV